MARPSRAAQGAAATTWSWWHRGGGGELRPDPEKKPMVFSKRLFFSNGFFFEMVSNGFSHGYFSNRFPIEITIRNHEKNH